MSLFSYLLYNNESKLYVLPLFSVPGNVNPVEAGRPTTTEAPKRPRTGCETLRKSAMEAETAAFMPVCDSDGEFEKVQCIVDEGNNKKKNCWCVAPDGREIAGTKKVEPDVPDCLYGKSRFLLTCCEVSLLVNWS